MKCWHLETRGTARGPTDRQTYTTTSAQSDCDTQLQLSLTLTLTHAGSQPGTKSLRQSAHNNASLNRTCCKNIRNYQNVKELLSPCGLDFCETPQVSQWRTLVVVMFNMHFNCYVFTNPISLVKNQF